MQLLLGKESSASQISTPQSALKEYNNVDVNENY